VEISFDEDHLNEMIVFADKDQLVRLFSNLLKNAVQAIPETRNGKITVKALKLKDNYLISIRDNGIGIAHDKLDKIFTPNFTTKTGGTGLGLAMAKNIVETAGGKIWFETRVEEGTVFYVSLPAYTTAVN
jgi:signal transduction histidine kinase